MDSLLMSVLGVSSHTNSKSVAEQFKDFRNSFRGDPQAKTNEMLSNHAQTANLISQLRPFPTPDYITCSPYQSANVDCIVSGFNTCVCNT